MDAVRRFWVDTEFLRRIAPAELCALCAGGTAKAGETIERVPQCRNSSEILGIGGELSRGFFGPN
jgi:hypothetical protein